MRAVSIIQAESELAGDAGASRATPSFQFNIAMICLTIVVTAGMVPFLALGYSLDMANFPSEMSPQPEPYQGASDGPWKIWFYRGATVRSWGRTNRLVMPGHPLDGTYLGHHEEWFPIIDRWLDHGDVPPPSL